MTQLHFSARQDVYADQLLADISGKIGNQEFESAEALLAKARPVLPRTILDILSARLLFARGAHDEAKRALTVATQRHPKDAALWAALGLPVGLLWSLWVALGWLGAPKCAQES